MGWGQICKAMKGLVNDADILSTLDRYKGAYAQIWKFNISHKKLAIRLSLSFEEESLYLLCIGCEFIRGPFSWDDCNIQYKVGMMSNTNGDILCSITDDMVDFKIIASGEISFFIVNENNDNFLEDF